MVNYAELLIEEFPNLKSFGLVNAFMINRELRTTSDYDIPAEELEQAEKFLIADILSYEYGN